MGVVDVAVIGGGAAGLAAAYELQQRGASFALLDTASRLGGVIRTEHVDGFTLDAGPDSLLVQKPAAIQLCEELGLGRRLMPTLEPRTAYVLRNRLLPIPRGSVLGIPTAIAPWALSRLLSPAAKFRMAAEVFIPRGDATQESVGAFFRRRFGREMVDFVAEPLLAGIHAGDVDRLSMRSLFPRLVDAAVDDCMPGRTTFFSRAIACSAWFLKPATVHAGIRCREPSLPVAAVIGRPACTSWQQYERELAAHARESGSIE